MKILFKVTYHHKIVARLFRPRVKSDFDICFWSLDEMCWMKTNDKRFTSQPYREIYKTQPRSQEKKYEGAQVAWKNFLERTPPPPLFMM